MARSKLDVAVLDDYQRLASSITDWTAIDADVSVTSIARHIDDPEELAAVLGGHQVLVAMRERTVIDARLLDLLPDLQLVVTTGPRNAVIDVAAANERGVVVSGTGGYITPTSEQTWALILGLLRHVPAEDKAIREGGWQHRLGSELAGRVLGIVGLGNLGSLVAGVGKAFGMEVIAWSENLTEERARAVGVTRVERDVLFGTSDVVTVHMQLSDRSRAMIGESDLRRMKSTAVIINTSRGPIIDEAALVTALSENWIAGAGLDVFDVEPLPVDHPLRSLSNTVLSPHVGYVTDGLYAQFFDEIVEDIAAFVAGQPIRIVAS